MENNMDWIKLSKELPPPNTLVWVKRIPNKTESQPIYIGTRMGLPISENIDPSRDCYWYGTDDLSASSSGINLRYHFSDVTVEGWRPIEFPKYNPPKSEQDVLESTMFATLFHDCNYTFYEMRELAVSVYDIHNYHFAESEFLKSVESLKQYLRDNYRKGDYEFEGDNDEVISFIKRSLSAGKKYKVIIQEL